MIDLEELDFIKLIEKLEEFRKKYPTYPIKTTDIIYACEKIGFSVDYIDLYKIQKILLETKPELFELLLMRGLI